MSETYADLLRAFRERKSVRGYSDQSLSQAELADLFTAAQQAPSWCNVQPWRVTLTGGDKTREVSEALLAAARSQLPSPEVPFPLDYPEPYLSHRRTCGYALYGAMGIERSDKRSRYDAWLRNYEFFGAPHLAVVARDRRLGEYATLDVGVWLGFLLAAAAVKGIDACPMASVAAYPDVLRKSLNLPDEQLILFGIALGREDASAPANACRTTREPVEANVRFVGFPAEG